jgi:hypothetical protein
MRNVQKKITFRNSECFYINWNQKNPVTDHKSLSNSDFDRSGKSYKTITFTAFIPFTLSSISNFTETPTAKAPVESFI